MVDKLVLKYALSTQCEVPGGPQELVESTSFIEFFSPLNPTSCSWRRLEKTLRMCFLWYKLGEGNGGHNGWGFDSGVKIFI